jgi:putative transposase
MQKSKDSDKDRAACKHPIKINVTQEKILMPWINSLRYLWNRNVALIDRLNRRKIRLFYDRILRLNNDTKKYEHFNMNGTNKHLTKIRARDIRQSSIPNCAQQEILRRLDKTYHMYLYDTLQRAKREQKISMAKNPKDIAKAIHYGFPKFKARYIDQISIYFSFERFSVEKEGDFWYLKASKVPGRMRILTNKDMPERIKNATISYDPVKRMWFASFSYITDFVAKDYPNKDVLGIDVGIKTSCYGSDGKTYNIDVSELKKLEKELNHLKKILSSKEKMSKRYIKLAHKKNVIERKISDIRRNFNHQLSKDVTDKFPIIGMEDLKVKNMMASAKGTVEKPGRNVRQKSGLNRSIARQGWYQLRSFVDYKQKKNGGVLALCNPAYSSVTCTSCGHVSKLNRNGESFKCEKCGFELNADYNASLEIRRRIIGSLPQKTLDKFGINEISNVL